MTLLSGVLFFGEFADLFCLLLHCFFQSKNFIEFVERLMSGKSISSSCLNQ